MLTVRCTSPRPCATSWTRASKCTAVEVGCAPLHTRAPLFGRTHRPCTALTLVLRAHLTPGPCPGLSDDFMLARAYAGMRGLRIADGPDEVHLRTIGQLEVKKFKARL